MSIWPLIGERFTLSSFHTISYADLKGLWNKESLENKKGFPDYSFVRFSSESLFTCIQSKLLNAKALAGNHWQFRVYLPRDRLITEKRRRADHSYSTHSRRIRSSPFPLTLDTLRMEIKEGVVHAITIIAFPLQIISWYYFAGDRKLIYIFILQCGSDYLYFLLCAANMFLGLKKMFSSL